MKVICPKCKVADNYLLQPTEVTCECGHTHSLVIGIDHALENHPFREVTIVADDLDDSEPKPLTPGMLHLFYDAWPEVLNTRRKLMSTVSTVSGRYDSSQFAGSNEPRTNVGRMSSTRQFPPPQRIPPHEILDIPSPGWRPTNIVIDDALPPADLADQLAGEVRELLNRITNIDFGDTPCDAESMLRINNMLSDLDMVSFSPDEEE